MDHVIDWQSCAVEWTRNGYELSAPLAADISRRQATAVADAVKAQLERLPRHGIFVAFVEPEDGSTAELLITSNDLLNIAPGFLRQTVDAAADTAANRAASGDAADAPVIAGWITALRHAP